MNKKRLLLVIGLGLVVAVATLVAVGWLGTYSGPMTAGFYIGPETASCGFEYKGLPGWWCVS